MLNALTRAVSVISVPSVVNLPPAGHAKNTPATLWAAGVGEEDKEKMKDSPGYGPIRSPSVNGCISIPLA